MKKTLLLFALCATFFTGCNTTSEKGIFIQVKNELTLPRSFETVELSKADLNLKEGASLDGLAIKAADGSFVTTQTIDQNGDGTADLLLFQPSLGPKEQKTFEILTATGTSEKTAATCYSRFVPERTDDYAWENDKVAFRTFGPTAQKMIEDKIKGGTLTSGMDAWLKKVDYPIIDKWYQKELSGKGSYHEDDGEGLDNFHVGISRGVGGIAVKKDTTYYVSKNFTSWKTISTGPIRTSFVLTYADWDANGSTIKEKKIISLDYGSNLSRFEVILDGSDTITPGLTLHEKDGTVTTKLGEGWLSYWEPHGDSELGTAIVVPNDALIGFDHYETNKKDESNLYAYVKETEGDFLYYAGFGWKESGQFDSEKEWEAYLSEFSQKLKSPIVVQLKK